MRIVWFFFLVAGVLGDQHEVTVYFIRHAQSVWNHLKGTVVGKHEPDDEPESVPQEGDASQVIPDIALPFQVKGKNRVKDAPLSVLGHIQAIELGKDLFSDDRKYAELAGLIKGNNGIVMVTSNLARTQQTLANVLNQRKEQDKRPVDIEIANFLQETSSFLDAWSSKGGRTDAKDAVPESMRDNSQFAWKFAHGTTRVEDLNEPLGAVANFIKGRMSGHQVEAHRSAEARIADFIAWLIYHRREGKSKFLVSGHSSWLRKLFRTRLGRDTPDINIFEEVLMDKKLGNASVIEFTIVLDEADDRLGWIKPGSTKVIRDVVHTFAGENSLVNEENRGALALEN